MTEVLDFYKKQISQLQENDWLDERRQQAMEQFSDQGFPSLKDEDWKYTKVDAIANQPFELSAYQKDDDNSYITNEECLTIAVIDGCITGLNDVQQQLPKGIVVMSLLDAAKKHQELVQSHLDKLAKNKHGFATINSALMQQGLFIHVDKNTLLDKPIKIMVKQANDNHAQHLRNLIVLEQGASATVVEHYTGNQGSYFTNTISEAFIADNASLTHLKIQDESLAAYHIGTLYAEMQKDSRIASHSFSFGGKVVRSDTQVVFEQSGGECLFNGLYLVDEGQHVDHHTIANHKVPHCNSDEFYKGILNGKSRAVFNGKVIVAKDAQKTNASQQNNNLLLAKSAEVDTKPELEIYADDVKCAHGATVGQLDEDSVFYLRSRGLSESQARDFLIHAFAYAILERCPLKAELAIIQQLLDNKLAMR